MSTASRDRIGAVLIAGVLTAQPILAQSASPARSVALNFEVASVRRCQTDVVSGRRKNASGGSSPVRLHLHCQSVMSLIQWAYVNFGDGHFNPFGSVPIVGGPAWIDSDRYEITAKAEKPQTRGTMNGPMLRALLEDRFQLKVHRETRTVPMYALAAGKVGPQMKASRAGSCVPFDPEHTPALEPGKPFPRLCGMSRVTNEGFDAPGVTMRDFCRLLSASLDRTVVDRTGIAGVFDIHLDLSAADLGHPGPSDPASPASPPDAGDILLAVRTSIQKIGLKLESVKGPGEFLVIDHVERPSGN